MKANFGDRQDWDGFAQLSATNPEYGRPEDRSASRAQYLLGRGLYPHLFPSNTQRFSLLDCGCSVGHWCHDFANMGLEVTGIDQSALAIDLARSLYPQLSFRQLSLTELDYREKFDIVSTITVLQHNTLPEQRTIINGLREALKPKGLLFSIENSGPTLPTKEELGNPIRTVHSVIGWIDLIGSHGFKLLEYQDMGWYLFQKT